MQRQRGSLVPVAEVVSGSNRPVKAIRDASLQAWHHFTRDLDPQANASAWLGIRDGSHGLLDVFADNGNLPDLVRSTGVSGVSLIPASAWLAGADKAVAGEVGAETILRQAMHALPKHWDYVLVDSPPSLGFLTVAALCAVQEAFVPVEASTMALAGVASLLHTVERVRERLNPELEVSVILVCRVDRRTNLARDVVERLRERFGDLVLDTVIRENVRLREAWSFSQPITQYAPRSAGAADYRAAAAELLAQHTEIRRSA